jgi:hypothetical protein
MAMLEHHDLLQETTHRSPGAWVAHAGRSPRAWLRRFSESAVSIVKKYAIAR